MLMTDPCVYCGGPGGTIEHITPWANGGSLHDTSNMAPACKECNGKRGNIPLLLFLLFRLEGRL
jgi:5-methylcytosine-specific restriction endonuclease McrA